MGADGVVHPSAGRRRRPSSEGAAGAPGHGRRDALAHPPHRSARHRPTRRRQTCRARRGARPSSPAAAPAAHRPRATDAMNGAPCSWPSTSTRPSTPWRAPVCTPCHASTNRAYASARRARPLGAARPAIGAAAGGGRRRHTTRARHLRAGTHRAPHDRRPRAPRAQRHDSIRRHVEARSRAPPRGTDHAWRRSGQRGRRGRARPVRCRPRAARAGSPRRGRRGGVRHRARRRYRSRHRSARRSRAASRRSESIAARASTPGTQRAASSSNERSPRSRNRSCTSSASRPWRVGRQPLEVELEIGEDSRVDELAQLFGTHQVAAAGRGPARARRL